MKIAWFTPYNKESAIGKYSQISSKIISKKHDVTLWVSESEVDLHEVFIPIIRYNFSDLNLIYQLNQYDIVVYNFGDNYKFHKDIFEVYKMKAGVVILHDYFMHDFFLEYFLQKDISLKQYFDSIGLIYGEKIKSVFEKSFHGKTKTSMWETNKIDAYPLFEPLLINATGIIGHSSQTMSLLEKIYPGYITELKSPYINSYVKTPVIPKKMTLSSNKVRLLTIGHINSNKRIDKVIKAIGNSKMLSNSVQYDVIGLHNNDGK